MWRKSFRLLNVVLVSVLAFTITPPPASIALEDEYPPSLPEEYATISIDADSVKWLDSDQFSIDFSVTYTINNRVRQNPTEPLTIIVPEVAAEISHTDAVGLFQIQSKNITFLGCTEGHPWCIPNSTFKTSKTPKNYFIPYIPHLVPRDEKRFYTTSLSENPVTLPAVTTTDHNHETTIDGSVRYNFRSIMRYPRHQLKNTETAEIKVIAATPAYGKNKTAKFFKPLNYTQDAFSANNYREFITPYLKSARTQVDINMPNQFTIGFNPELTHANISIAVEPISPPDPEPEPAPPFLSVDTTLSTQQTQAANPLTTTSTITNTSPDNPATNTQIRINLPQNHLNLNDNNPVTCTPTGTATCPEFTINKQQNTITATTDIPANSGLTITTNTTTGYLPENPETPIPVTTTATLNNNDTQSEQTFTITSKQVTVNSKFVINANKWQGNTPADRANITGTLDCAVNGHSKQVPFTYSLDPAGNGQYYTRLISSKIEYGSDCVLTMNKQQPPKGWAWVTTDAYSHSFKALQDTNTVDAPVEITRKRLNVTAPPLPYTGGVASDLIYILGVITLTTGATVTLLLKRYRTRKQA